MTELKIEELLDMIGRRDVPAIKAYFADQNPIDIAELLSEDAELPLAKLYRLLPKTLAAEVFVEMDSDTQAKADCRALGQGNRRDDVRAVL